MKKTRKRSATTARQSKQSAFGEYCNRVNVHFGVDEATIRFSRVRATGNEQMEWESEDVTSVTLPLTVAKMLVFGLMGVIAPLESITGVIRVAPGLIPQIPSSPLFTPEVVARLAVLHAELFPLPVSQPEKSENRPETTEARSVTKH